MKSASVLTALLALTILLAACGDGGGGESPTPTAVSTATALAPTQPPPTETPAPPAVSIPNTAPATEINLPQGFSAYAIAEGFFRPTSLAVAPDGAIYVSLRHGGVERLVDADGDGVFEDSVTFTEGFDETTGIAFSPDGALYVSSRGRVTAYRDTEGDGVSDVSAEIAGGLPNGRHQNNGLAFGPDGKLYITNGSTCDDCVEANERSATILQANPDGSAVRVYATGLRNPYDIAFDGDGRLWSTDNGSDEPCATVDELNLIEDGGDYGWPYGADGCDPFNDGSPPVAGLGLHTASTGIDWYRPGNFPAAYQASAYLTLWGSFFAAPELRPALYRVSIVPDDLGGQPAGIVEEFAAGLTNPIDVLFDRDGTLLLLDYGSGTLYRIVYTG